MYFKDKINTIKKTPLLYIIFILFKYFELCSVCLNIIESFYNIEIKISTTGKKSMKIESDSKLFIKISKGVILCNKKFLE